MLTIFHSSLFPFFPLWTRRLKMHFEQRCAKRQSAHFKTATRTMFQKKIKVALYFVFTIYVL